VAFAVRGERDAIVCIPRKALAAFYDDLDAGRLDDSILQFLASPPSGRVLRAVDQAGTPGLFDELSSPGAIAPPERLPGRSGPFGRGGGSPTGPRRDKRSRTPRPRRLLAIAAAGAAIVVVAGAAIALGGGSDKKATTVAAGASVGTTTPASVITVPGPCTQFDVAGTWTIQQGTGAYTPTIVLEQVGTQLTGTMTLPDSQFRTSGWVSQTNPLSGTMSGDHVIFTVVAPHQDGVLSQGVYEGTVTEAGVSEGSAKDLAVPSGGSVQWSMAGPAKCVSH
jgi:hypothetical protein